VKPWEGVRVADAFAPGPMQPAMVAIIMGAPANLSEDCLYLNVWTPAKSANDHIPVLVWIYGGGFGGGATSEPNYSGEKLAKKGVVLVSIAYRVGQLGFLAHPELSAETTNRVSGNYGLLDMISGLQWVQRNIASFGGDPHHVTIFGESAGGIAVGMLSAAPAAKGLFQRAISESGGSFAPPRIADEAGQNVPSLKLAESNGESFLKKLGAADIKAARALPAEQIQKAAGVQGKAAAKAKDIGAMSKEQQADVAYIRQAVNDDEGDPARHHAAGDYDTARHSRTRLVDCCGRGDGRRS